MQIAKERPLNPYGLIYRINRLRQYIFNYILLIVLAFFFLFPLVFMIVASFKNNEMQIIRDMGNIGAFIPYGDLGLKNYTDVFRQMPFWRFMFNSVFIVTATVFAGLFINSMIAYALSRLKFRGQRIILSFIIALIIIPAESVVIPLLLIVNRFGWLDTYHVQIIPFIADPFSIFLFYQFFTGLPRALDEAALIDGAGPLQVYWKVIIPLSKPVFATVAILQFLFRWGEFLWPLMVTRGYEHRPLTVAIQQFFSQDPKVWGDIFAFAAMVTIPALILFLLFQKWFIHSVASTGIKG